MAPVLLGQFQHWVVPTLIDFFHSISICLRSCRRLRRHLSSSSVVSSTRTTGETYTTSVDKSLFTCEVNCQGVWPNKIITDESFTMWSDHRWTINSRTFLTPVSPIQDSTQFNNHSYYISSFWYNTGVWRTDTLLSQRPALAQRRAGKIRHSGKMSNTKGSSSGRVSSQKLRRSRME